MTGSVLTIWFNCWGRDDFEKKPCSYVQQGGVPSFSAWVNVTDRALKTIRFSLVSSVKLFGHEWCESFTDMEEVFDLMHNDETEDLRGNNTWRPECVSDQACAPELLVQYTINQARAPQISSSTTEGTASSTTDQAWGTDYEMVVRTNSSGG